MLPSLGAPSTTVEVGARETLASSVKDAGVAPWVMSVCNGTGVAVIVLLEEPGGTAPLNGFNLGIITGVGSDDVAIRGAGKDGVP